MRQSKLLLVTLLTFLLTLSACSGSDDYADDLFAGPDECSQIGQNRFVFDVMEQWYYWNDTIPTNINPDNYNSIDSLLDALVVNSPEVDNFSYIADQETSNDFFDYGEFTGLGFTSRNIDNHLLIALVFAGSPADELGLQRGDEITVVDGIDVVTTLSNGNSVNFGSNTIGTIVDIEYTDSSNTSYTASLIKDVVTINPAPVSSVIDNNGVLTGYLHFYTFISPSNAALDAAFSEFENAGISELIVDVRYNGGGMISVANYLAGLIGGVSTDGEILSKRLHNADRAANNDETTYFEDQVHGLDLTRVAFITAGGSASASELVINSLDPFLDVVLIGDTTYGKPVGQYGFDFCGNTLFPVSFETVNANDRGGYFGGLLVDCPAADDLTAQLGDVTEASLSEALTYLNTGACSPIAATFQQATKTKPAVLQKESIEIIQQWKLLDAH